MFGTYRRPVTTPWQLPLNAECRPPPSENWRCSAASSLITTSRQRLQWASITRHVQYRGARQRSRELMDRRR